MKRLKIVLPQWEGGVNPNYVLGARLMDLIVPTLMILRCWSANTASMPTRPCKVN